MASTEGGLASTISNSSCMSAKLFFTHCWNRIIFYKPNICNMALKLSRFTFKGHPPSLFLSDKDMVIEYLEIHLQNIWFSWRDCPSVHPIWWTSLHEVTFPGSHLCSFPGSPVSFPLLSFRPRLSRLHGGENYSNHTLRHPWACHLQCDPEPFS